MTGAIFFSDDLFMKNCVRKRETWKFCHKLKIFTLHTYVLWRDCSSRSENMALLCTRLTNIRYEEALSVTVLIILQNEKSYKPSKDLRRQQLCPSNFLIQVQLSLKQWRSLGSKLRVLGGRSPDSKSVVKPRLENSQGGAKKIKEVPINTMFMSTNTMFKRTNTMFTKVMITNTMIMSTNTKETIVMSTNTMYIWRCPIKQHPMYLCKKTSYISALVTNSS